MKELKQEYIQSLEESQSGESKVEEAVEDNKEIQLSDSLNIGANKLSDGRNKMLD